MSLLEHIIQGIYRISTYPSSGWFGGCWRCQRDQTNISTILLAKTELSSHLNSYRVDLDGKSHSLSRSKLKGSA